MLAALRLRYHCISKVQKLLTLVVGSTYSPHKVVHQFLRHVNFKRRSLPNFNEGTYGSRFHPPSAIEHAEERIRSHLSDRTFHSIEDWTELRSELMTDLDALTDTNFNSVLMNCLLTLNKIQEAHSFMKYLEHMELEPNFLTYLKYMALCGRNVKSCGQEVILETFQRVKKTLDLAPVLDLKRVEHVIEGLCATDQWRLSFYYLKKTAQSPYAFIKNCLASAAVRNGDEDLSWEILTTWFKRDDCPANEVLKEFVLFVLNLQHKDQGKAEQMLTKLFLYIQQKGFVVKEDVAKLFEEYFNRNLGKWQVQYTKVSRNGECSGCRGSLKVVDLSEKDFITLKKYFLKRSLQKDNLFINTTEREFEQYINFINSHKPFDIVLDGLNAAYSSPLGRNKECLSRQLLKVVEHLSKSSQRLLVLGKYHMKHWPNRVMEKISNKATLFYTSNISQDDPFMVYAALASGPHCLIVSMDLMRDHVSRLDDPRLIFLFQQWQQTHQILLEVDDKDNSLKFREPLRHSINIQGSMQEGWHIPFDDQIILSTYEELNNWLCIKKINK